jgi:hypothetical protein
MYSQVRSAACDTVGSCTAAERQPFIARQPRQEHPLSAH